MDEYPRLRIAGIEPESFVDGPGIRMTIFTQGCHHNCPGCQNPQTHDFNGGHFIDIEEILSMIDENPLLDGITFSGGDPMDQALALVPLAREIKERGLNLVIFTGYTFEYLQQHWDEINEWCDDYEDGIIQECVLPLVPERYHDIALEMLRNEYHKCCYTLDMMDECWDCH